MLVGGAKKNGGPCFDVCGKREGRTWGICTRRAGKLYRARSRPYRSQFLQQKMRWKALAEIYTMHSFAPFYKLNFCSKVAKRFAIFCRNL